MIVSKYGGSSITSEEDIERIGHITEEHPDRLVVVVSAPGKRDEGDEKLTDMLIQYAADTTPEQRDTIMQRLHELNPSYNTSQLESELERRTRIRTDKRRLDAIKAFGEFATATIIADTLGYQLIPAEDIIRVTPDFGDATILDTSQRLVQNRLEEHFAGSSRPVVIPGFSGRAGQHIATFRRGGTDRTGAFVASAIGADLYENWTDTDGICAAQPKYVDDPIKLDEITFREMFALSYLGFDVFQVDALSHVEDAEVPVHVRSTALHDNPNATGTRIVPVRTDIDRTVLGVGYRSGFTAVELNTGFDYARRNNPLLTALGVFDQIGIPVEYYAGSRSDITLVLEQHEVDQHVDALTDLYRALRKFLPGSSISIAQGLGCLVVAGLQMKGKPGTAASVAQTLANHGVNIQAQLQGEGELSMVYVIDDAVGHAAVNAVYEEHIAA